jgi:SAM-dependent MidA family methyltransferase
LAAQNPSAHDGVLSAIARLTDSQQMGTLFKSLAIMPPDTKPPPGF